MKTSGLLLKISVPVITIILLIMGIYGFMTYSLKKDKMYKELKVSISRIKKRLHKNLSPLLYNEDHENAKNIILSEIKENFIQSIIVLDEQKKEIKYGFRKNNKKKTIIETREFKFFKDETKRIRSRLTYEEEDTEQTEIYVVGFLDIYISDSAIKQNLKTEKYILLLTIFLIGASLAFTIYVLIKEIVVQPLEKISEISSRVANGDFSQRVEKKFISKNKDEISLLSKSINNMTDKIEKLTTGLKNEVDAQTKEIQLQNESFFSLLSNLDQGFLVLDYKGEVTSDSTEITKSIFGVDPKGKNITDIFKLNFTEKKGYLKWLSHVFGGMMNFKDLLPLTKKSLHLSEDHIFSLDYRPIYQVKKRKKVEKLICILKDVTKERNIQKKVNEANEKSEMILKLIDSPIEFLDIISELQGIIDSHLQNPKVTNYEVLFRTFHTLKARFANYKVSRIVKAIHELETDLFSMMNLNKKVESSQEHFGQSLKKGKEFQKLEKSIEFNIYDIGEVLKDFLKKNRSIIEMAQNCLNSGEKLDELHNARVELLKFNDFITRSFINKNVKDSFNQYIPPAKELAKSQDKEVNIIIGESDIHIKVENYKEFFDTLHHVFRNCIDHGIEERQERIDQNKKESASIEVVFKRKGLLFFQIAIKDDGRGIDPQKIKSIALKKEGLKELDFDNMDKKEIIQLIFEPGFSSKEEATEISGRGIGMDAVKKTAEDLEGKVWVESEIGEGMLLVAELPILK